MRGSHTPAQRGEFEHGHGSARRAAIISSVLSMAGLAACASAPAPRIAEPPIISRYLSGEANDWEPTLAVGPDSSVVVIAGRKMPAAAGAVRPMGEMHMVTWSSSDGGTTFGPDRTFPQGGGDERMKSDRNGTLFASWIRIEWDSTGRRVDFSRGGLVLAKSRDKGATWQTTIAAPMGSGVGDKPELVVSPDGRDVYIAFMANGTLDVVASHDGGASWERHVADTTRTGHWPTSIALAPNGDIWITDVRRMGNPRDSILQMDLVLLHSTNRGSTWTQRIVSRSTRVNRPGDCVHGPTCPVQIPYPAVAVDDRNRVYLAYTQGEARRRYDVVWTRSIDAGRSWSEPIVLASAPRRATSDPADNFYPMIAAQGDGLVYLVWFDDRDGPLNLWARRSTDGGGTWTGDVRLSRAEGIRGIYGEYGGLGIDGRGRLHVAWPEGTGHVSTPEGTGGTWYVRWDGRIP
jgi:hypothetical protein